VKIVGDDKNADLYCFIEDYVSAIRYTANGPLAKVGKNELPVANILNISQPEHDSQQQNVDITETQILSLLGKKVQYKQSDIKFSPESGKTLNLNIDFGGASSATLHIVDAQGVVVQSIHAQATKDKTAQIQIPCLDFNNNGPYTVKLAMPSSAILFGEGIVEGITKSNNSAKLRINGISVPISDIFDIALQKTNA
jgi:hypothetical protein